MKRNRLSMFLLFLILSLICPVAQTVHADLVVEISSTDVDISSGAGIVTAGFDISIGNTGSDDAPIAGYTFFLDIEPVGQVLPTGVAFADPAATYLVGNGIGPLIGASTDGTLNLDPAFGDLGLGQIQFFDGTIAAGETFTFLTVNLEIDLSTAEAGEFSLFLNPDGENTISSIGVPTIPNVDFTSIGTLRLVNSTAIPEPSSTTAIGLLVAVVMIRRRRS